LFKKLFASGSVEEEAMQAFMAKKKAEDMREELKNLISFTRGPSAWEELLKTEADIRKKRQQAIYDQQERQRKLFEIIMVILASAAMIGFIGFVIYLVGVGQGKW
jgi:preprotein translocase subunit Sss1